MRTRYVDWLLTAVLVLAAGHAVAQGTTDVIDGAKTPDLIPDDQAYHLVLMAASAADNGSEVEKARAKAVRAMILGPDTDADLPALAEVANHHRKTLTGYIAESKRGNTDAERLKSEHLGRVKAEAELRLPAAARKALAEYVKTQKKAMKIHGKPDPQGTGIGVFGYCDGGSGGLAPYCRDGCSGARPCDKLCRRDDESCTTCGEYGVCCCLGGGGGPTPTPTPTPPPGGMTGSPSGTTYTNISISGSTFYATAVTDSSASCSCHSSRAQVTIRAPWGQAFNSSGVVGPYAQTTATYTMSEAEFEVEAEIRAESDYYSFCPIVGVAFIAKNSIFPALIEKYQAVLQKDRFDETIRKWVYMRRDHICVGVCQPKQLCSTQECKWLYERGYKFKLWSGISGCAPIPPNPRCSDTQRECKQKFGIMIWAGDNGCKAE